MQEIEPLLSKELTADDTVPVKASYHREHPREEPRYAVDKCPQSSYYPPNYEPQNDASEERDEARLQQGHEDMPATIGCPPCPESQLDQGQDVLHDVIPLPRLRMLGLLHATVGFGLQIFWMSFDKGLLCRILHQSRVNYMTHEGRQDFIPTT